MFADSIQCSFLQRSINSYYAMIIAADSDAMMKNPQAAG